MAVMLVNGAEIPCPSGITYGLQDVSKSDAGRDESGLMYKGLITRKVKLSLTWNGIKFADAHRVIQAFTSSEYFSVTYCDPYECSSDEGRVTKEFYRGDVSAPFYWQIPGKTFFQNVAFDIIER